MALPTMQLLREPSWRVLLALCVVLVTTGELVLLKLGTGYFGSGFNAPHVARGADDVATYFAAAFFLDLAFVLGLWAAGGALLRALGVRRLPSFFALALLGTGLPLAGAVGIYNLHVTLGRLVRLSLLHAGSAGGSSQMASMAFDELPPFGAVAAAGALAGAFTLLWIARLLELRFPRLAPRRPPPIDGRLWLTFAVAVAVGTALLTVTHSHAPWLYYGLSRKASGKLLAQGVQRATDLDGDGFGVLLQRPPDPAPFDPRIHPYAADVPGNGIDENGLGGDLPVDFQPPRPVQPKGAPAAARPHLLLIYLESFRTDLLDRTLGGRQISPFLSRLAREGVRSEHAWVHSPWTLPSRSQLFAGAIGPRPGDPTLVDDFKARGYRVALFSGQDDTYGNSVALMGAERADHFYHARHDLDRRTSRSTAPVSLQVSWKTLLEHTLDFLEDASPDEPLFLYFNVVDTHYPYFHDEIDPILDVEPITRDDIRADSAQRVFEAYANTAANVDRAVARVVRAWRERMAGRPQAILVTGDHGQSFYENGTLGHGQSLLADQARVPFILWRIGGAWPEPIAPSDIRGLLDRNLFAAPREASPRARFVPDPDRAVFQYLGGLEQPERLGWRSLDRLLQLDVLRSRAQWVGSGGAPLEEPMPPDRVARLVHTWESYANER